jgi:hypothetical protein
MVPDPRWVRFFKMFPMLQCGSFPLFSLPLPLNRKLPIEDGYEAVPLSLADPRIDDLWRASARLHGCTVVRSARTLPYKIAGFGVLRHEDLFTITGVVERGSGALIGLAASRRKGDRQWLVCDVLARDAGSSLRATLAAVSNLADEKARKASPDAPIRKVALLATPVIEPVARSLGYARDAYDFPFVIHRLDPALPKEDIAPARWYVSAND